MIIPIRFKQMCTCRVLKRKKKNISYRIGAQSTTTNGYMRYVHKTRIYLILLSY